VTAYARVGGAPAEPAKQREVARGEVANGLGHDRPVARRGQHPVEDPLRVRQEVVQAGLEDDGVGVRERLVARGEVEPARVDPAALELLHEPGVDVDPDVAARPRSQVPQVQRARTAAQLEHRSPVGHFAGDRPHPV